MFNPIRLILGRGRSGRVPRETDGTIRVGRPQVKPWTPAHTPGVREGNELGSYEKQPGHLPDGRSTSRRSTGVNAGARNPIDDRMPNLSPP